MNSKVDALLAREKRWQAEMEMLRSILLDCPLTEEFKWGHPCYTVDGGNVVLIHGFKQYCALLLFKGALMADADGILIQQTKNVQSGRQMRFRDLAEIQAMEPTIRRYIAEAIEVEKAGLKVEHKKTEDYPVPEEFQHALDDDAELRAAFEALTPGRQRGYLVHFASAKQSKTRAARVTKHRERIMEGKGLND